MCLKNRDLVKIARKSNQMCDFSTAQLFNCSTIQLLNYSTIQLFNYSTIQLLNYSTAQLLLKQKEQRHACYRDDGA